MPDTRTVKKIFKWKPLTKRSQGRPKYRWEGNIKEVKAKVKQSRYRPGVAQRVPGSQGSQIS